MLLARRTPIPQPLRTLSLRTTNERVAQLEEWAQQNGLGRSAAADHLLRYALETPDETRATIADLAIGMAELRPAIATIQGQLARLEALVNAAGQVSAIAPLLLAHWQSSELGVRANSETPEQAEDRLWRCWSDAANVEWDARRRRAAPTDEEIALEHEPEPLDLPVEPSESTDGALYHDDETPDVEDAHEPEPSAPASAELAHDANDDDEPYDGF